MTTRRCAQCNGANPRFQCGRCLDAAYCNAGCQLADWPKHKRDCTRAAVGEKFKLFDVSQTRELSAAEVVALFGREMVDQFADVPFFAVPASAVEERFDSVYGTEKGIVLIEDDDEGSADAAADRFADAKQFFRVTANRARIRQAVAAERGKLACSGAGLTKVGGYWVLDMEKKTEAAAMLDSICARAKVTLKEMRGKMSHYTFTPTMRKMHREVVKTKDFFKNVVRESPPRRTSLGCYRREDGEDFISITLRRGDTAMQFIPADLVLHTLLHELAHLVVGDECGEGGPHGPRFVAVNGTIVRAAGQLGVIPCQWRMFDDDDIFLQQEEDLLAFRLWELEEQVSISRSAARRRRIDLSR